MGSSGLPWKSIDLFELFINSANGAIDFDNLFKLSWIAMVLKPGCVTHLNVGIKSHYHSMNTQILQGVAKCSKCT